MRQLVLFQIVVRLLILEIRLFAAQPVQFHFLMPEGNPHKHQHCAQYHSIKPACDAELSLFCFCFAHRLPSHLVKIHRISEFFYLV